MIHSIRSDLHDYEVGKDNVVKIEFFEHQKINTIYQIHFKNDSYLFVGASEFDVILE